MARPCFSKRFAPVGIALAALMIAGAGVPQPLDLKDKPKPESGPASVVKGLSSDLKKPKLDVAECADAWSLTGNANSHWGVNFLGTNDDQPLVFKTNGVEGMILTKTHELWVKRLSISPSPSSSNPVSLSYGERGPLYITDRSGWANLAVGGIVFADGTVQRTAVMKGDKGDQGANGDPGIPGKNGVDGKNGKDGTAGKDGAQGPPGPAIKTVAACFSNAAYDLRCGCKDPIQEQSVGGGQCEAVAEVGRCNAIASGSPGDRYLTYALCCVCRP